LIAGALFGASGVVLGAWGAHGLEAYLGHSNISAWSTAVLYQLIHAIALLCVGALLSINSSRTLVAATWLIVAGVLLFSGSLYGLTLGAPTWMGPLTPLGGICLVCAWLALTVAAFQWPRQLK